MHHPVTPIRLRTGYAHPEVPCATYRLFQLAIQPTHRHPARLPPGFSRTEHPRDPFYPVVHPAPGPDRPRVTQGVQQERSRRVHQRRDEVQRRIQQTPGRRRDPDVPRRRSRGRAGGEMERGRQRLGGVLLSTDRRTRDDDVVRIVSEARPLLEAAV